MIQAARFYYYVVLLVAWLQPCWAMSSPAPLTTEELTNLMVSLKGDDTRLFRWDVTEHTSERQKKGDCDKLVQVANWLITDGVAVQKTPQQQAVAIDYLTLCITNHPFNRATFSNVQRIHEAVISLVSSDDQRVSALACHLIYIATYTNEKNHQSFYTHGAVPALAKLLMNEHSTAIQQMWAACALQNLAASYCKTFDDGTCHWEWTATNEHIQLMEDSPLYSDATPVRKQILSTEGLVDTLLDLACRGPIAMDDDDNNDAMPGSTALAGEHDDRGEIVTWAAMGTLKNLSLEPTAKPLLEGQALTCACFLKESPDWLESSKAFDFIYYMRRGADPCWIVDDGSAICVDDNFLDHDMYHCDDYSQATEDECESAVDMFTGKTASEMCCECFGGSHHIFEETHDEL